MTKKLLAILISVFLVVSCMIVPAMAADLSDSWDGLGENLTKDNSVTLTIDVPEKANYQVEYDGKIAAKDGEFMTFIVEAQGQTLMQTVECNNANEKSHVVVGTLALEKGETDFVFTNISTVDGGTINTKTIKLTLTKTSEYDAVAAHTVYQTFTDIVAEGSSTIKSVGNEVGASEWVIWNVNVPADGTYTAYMYGGAQSSGTTKLNGRLYVYGAETLFEIPNTGTNGWANRKYLTLGDVALRKGDNNVRFALKSTTASTQANAANKIYFVRKDNASFVYDPSIDVTTGALSLSNSGGLMKTNVEVKSTYAKNVAIDAYLALYDNNGSVIKADKATAVYAGTSKAFTFANIPYDTEYATAKLFVWEHCTLIPVCKAIVPKE